MATRPPLLPFVFVLTGVLALSACAASSTPAAEIASPSPTPTTAVTVSPSPEASPTASSDVSTVVYTSCEDVITPAFRQTVSDNGWVGWNMVGQEIGHSPFDRFPDGAPTGQLSCRFGAGPEVATDNVIDLAWAPIDATTAAAAQRALEAEGFQRVDTADAVQWGMRPGDGGWKDDDGWGQTYSFTGSEVRWAVVRSELDLLQPPA
ncbi:hypothetical protein QE418_000148 [Microbacterium testaceum]|uniref:hypothetical protein n=1 Tax=Microbacterium TaxID=33882 RepID=UPI00278718CE|nr:MULTISPECIES: hypothetical protein [Microbacterium]MDQ1110700.1 hypothetical protein [Microbacterium testaceum]MDR6098754.1 hypothetical protein [Microbacterium sp. SORGH_AS_0454]